mmetsp:Transcript_12860/g.19930  ORF Transcript_12860/g.19930 Transcript_12860/m.19930 type:complete len:92 (-) Transcript_12860:245-520(-)
MFELQSKDDKYRSLYETFISMICIRLFFYALICSFFACMSVFVCCAIASGQQHIISVNQERIERVTPVHVKRLLKRTAKKFNPLGTEAEVG